MSRRKQARPQHYASSEEELDHEPELDTSSRSIAKTFPENGSALRPVNDHSDSLSSSINKNSSKAINQTEHENSHLENFVNKLVEATLVPQSKELFGDILSGHDQESIESSAQYLHLNQQEEEEEEANNENLNSVNTTKQQVFKKRVSGHKDSDRHSHEQLPLASVVINQTNIPLHRNQLANLIEENGKVDSYVDKLKLENGHLLAHQLEQNHSVHSKVKNGNISHNHNENVTSPLKSDFNVNLSIVSNMKNNSSSTGGTLSKNLCDKCGGSYATLAALISHKKSCKGIPNKKRLPPDHGLASNKVANNSSQANNATENKVNEEENAMSEEARLKLIAEAAAAGLDSSTGYLNPLGQWPVDFFPPPFSSPSPDMGALLESLTPFFSLPNADPSEPPTAEEQQAAIFTQQMMFFHMLQQLQGVSQIPPLPLLAAAAAAAAQQQAPLSCTPPPPHSSKQDHADEDTSTPQPSASTEQQHISKTQLSRTSASYSASVNNLASDAIKPEEVKGDDKELDDLKRPPSTSSSCTSVSAAHNSSTRKLLSSLLDLKDTNPDAPLPPMMSPPKSDATESVSFSEPNTLELLQKHTEQALQNTMSGGSFLLNGLSPSDSNDLLSFRKGKDGKEDATCRHRCKFCGKVFGSDSALQIHIRSHTGERPFKCNICGNRFTTKGNLKVHFQRHKAKYPHVKMNPHPVPEHLDKFHPPLEPPSNSQSPPPPPPGLFSSTSSTSFPHSNALHIPAIFSSTLIPYGSDDSAKSDVPKSSGDRQKSKSQILFEFSEMYKSHMDSKNDQPLSLAFSGDESSKSEHSETSQCENEDIVSMKNNIKEEESDTDLDSEDESELKKNSDEDKNVNSIPDKDKEENNLNDESKINDSEADTNHNQPQVDSDDELSNDNSEFGSTAPSSLPASFGLMGLPFGLDPSSISNSAALPTSLSTVPLPGQPFTRNENEPELADAAAKDPIFYQNLLPKPGSTDNTWETLMEVQKASETVKLQQLVDNIEHKLNDPNQCIICQRVLSCKSALQMHYRTHTGERPFKCKICGRAFTTKGNLKTHMGVHRVKPPLRMLHQCPICHKQFTNALVLQQHIRLHSVEPGSASNPEISSEMLAELKNNPLLPSNFPRAFLPPSLGGSFPMLPGGNPIMFPSSLITDMENSQMKKPSPLIPSFEASAPKESSECDKESNAEQNEEEASDLSMSPDKKRKIEENKSKVPEEINDSTEVEEELEEVSPVKKKRVDSVSGKERKTKPKPENTLSALENHVLKSTSQISPQSKGLFSKANSENELVLDLTPKSSQDSRTGSEDDEGRVMSATPFAGLPYHPTGRPNTTCRICLKTFACFSALEIHYRSHTKERPFKCEVCDRGFSTKGNMKQHMLTHKIRDLPPDLYTTVSPSSNTTLGNFLTSSNISKLIGKQSTTNSSNNSNSSSRVSSPHTPNGHNSNSVDSDKMRNTESPAGDQSSTSSRTSGSNKHMCNICNKPFSSGSALQIHMRTHTGDKPFKCTICGRAFTTKGNLKVHMGTHMWNNNPSRRGRRMSIDLPNLHISPPNVSSSKPQPEITPSPVNTNSDLFFPYLSPHFLNGPDASQLAMQQMMLMKMMSSQQMSMSQRSDKPTASINGDDDEGDNGSLNSGDDRPKSNEVLCEPEIELNENGRRQEKESDFFDTGLHANNDDDEEERSFKSDLSNQHDESGWSTKQWKMPCTICNHVSISPSNFEEHIKAHLHAAVAASSNSEQQAKSANNSVSTAKAAGVLS